MQGSELPAFMAGWTVLIFILLAFLALDILLFALWVIALVDCAKRKENEFQGGRHTRIVWVAVLIVSFFIGLNWIFAPIYYFTVMRKMPKGQRDSNKKLLALRQAVKYKGLRIGVMDYKFTDSWEEETSSIKKPEEGAKFIWIYVKAENIGDDLIALPSVTDFDVRYKERRLPCLTPSTVSIVNEPTYRPKEIYPGYGSEGWLIYEVYKEAKPEDTKVGFLSLRGSTNIDCYWKLEK